MGELERDRERKAAARADARTVWIPPREDSARRRRLEGDVEKWLRWYLPDVFSRPFTSNQQTIIHDILATQLYGGDQAFAAPRGDAKTTLTEGVTIYTIVQALIDFAVIFSATATDAGNSLGSIKDYIVESDRMAADYPEIVLPAREAHAIPNKAHSMLASGRCGKVQFTQENIQFQWSGDEIILPKVPGSPCAGAIIATRGLDSAVRGLKKGKRRPQFAMIDDPDTEDTANNPAQAVKLEKRIDRAIALLAPPGRRIARVMLTTIQNKICVSYRFTDPNQKPSWNGKRFRFLATPPDRADLWADYVSLRREDMRSGDRYGRRAHAWYIERREIMDSGAEVSNASNFDQRILTDGTQTEVSAIQRYYNVVADMGQAAADSELQNSPSDDEGVGVKLDAAELAKRCNGLRRGEAPKTAQWVSSFVDVHGGALYWIAVAWSPGFAGSIIDYGTYPDQPVSYFSQPSIPVPIERLHPGLHEDATVLAALNAFVPRLAGRTFEREQGGDSLRMGRILIDSGWKKDVVCQFCRRSPFGDQIRPSRGEGIGAKNSPMDEWKRGDGTLRGLHWLWGPDRSGERVTEIDTNWWKTTSASRLLLPVGTPGAWDLWGRDPDQHRLIADHWTSQKADDVAAKGRRVKEWTDKPGQHETHWWDGLVGCAVGASGLGCQMPESGSVRRRRRGRVIIQEA